MGKQPKQCRLGNCNEGKGDNRERGVEVGQTVWNVPIRRIGQSKHSTHTGQERVAGINEGQQ